MRYSALRLLWNGLRGNRDWKPAWRQPDPKLHYDIVIVITWPRGGSLYHLQFVAE